VRIGLVTPVWARWTALGLVCFFAIALLIALPTNGRLWIRNRTTSMPVGYYIILDRHPRVIARGDIVEACLPEPMHTLARERNYLEAGPWCDGEEPVLKLVAALAGDHIRVLPNAVCINGQRIDGSDRWARDDDGRGMPMLKPGGYVVRPGDVWLESPASGSWDSRYYNAIPIRSVQARLWFVGPQPSLRARAPCGSLSR
jgi:conjugative transfer signal peptidase TraF